MEGIDCALKGRYVYLLLSSEVLLNSKNNKKRENGMIEDLFLFLLFSRFKIPFVESSHVSRRLQKLIKRLHLCDGLLVY